jgi:hypothetical protein
MKLLAKRNPVNHVSFVRLANYVRIAKVANQKNKYLSRNNIYFYRAKSNDINNILLLIPKHKIEIIIYNRPENNLKIKQSIS